MDEGIVGTQSTISPLTKASLLEHMLYCLEILYICKVACQFTVGFYVLVFSFCLENQKLKIARTALYDAGTEEHTHGSSHATRHLSHRQFRAGPT